MDPTQWVQFICNSIHALFNKSRRAASSALKRIRDWLLEPLRTDERLYFIAKLIGLAFGTAFVWFFGWRGLLLTQESIRATIQGNKLSAKQICSNSNLTAGDRLWCDDFNHDIPLSTIVDARDWIAVSASTTRTWLNAKLATVSLCGTYSVAERRGDTCISLGIALALLFLTRSPSLDRHFKPALLRDYVAPVLALLTDFRGRTFFDVAVSLIHVFVFSLLVGLGIADYMDRQQRKYVDEIFTGFSTGMTVALGMYLVIWISQSLYYNTGECLFYFAVIGFAIWRGSRDETKRQAQSPT